MRLSPDSFSGFVDDGALLNEFAMLDVGVARALPAALHCLQADGLPLEPPIELLSHDANVEQV